MHIAALIILEGAPLLDRAGHLRMDVVRPNVQRRLHLAPRLRQVLITPRPGLGPPAWADAAGFDISEHIRARAIPPPGDEATLLGLCAELNERPLDRTRPLWEMWLLTGLPDGNVGMLIRLHHVVADGIAAIAMIGALFDASPDEQPPAAPPWVPGPPPGPGQLLAGHVRQRARAVAGALQALLHPAGLVSRLATVVRQIRRVTRDGRAPQVSLNRPVGGHRSLLLVRADLSRAHAVAHAHGGKINDVVLAAVARGARRLLEARGELRPGLVLKASVAVSVRDGAGERPTGNRVGVMIAPLPVTEADPVRLLEAIARATAERKRQPPISPLAGSCSAGWCGPCPASTSSTCWSAISPVRLHRCISRAHGPWRYSRSASCRATSRSASGCSRTRGGSNSTSLATPGPLLTCQFSPTGSPGPFTSLA